MIARHWFPNCINVSYCLPDCLHIQLVSDASVLLPQVTRHVFDETQGKSEPVSEVIEVPIKPGWKAGTKVTYAGERQHWQDCCRLTTVPVPSAAGLSAAR